MNDTDEDSMATTALFLHLSCEAQPSLSIWIPLSKGWDIVSPILLPYRDRIRKITLQTDSEAHSAECRYKTDISDAKILHNLRRVFETLDLPTSIEYLDIILGRPVRLNSTWVPPNIASAGNWLIPSRILESSSHSFPKLRYLSMYATDLVALFPHISVLGQLQNLHFHSEEQDYIEPLPPAPATDDMAPLHMPFLNTLQYHGRLHWASTKLLSAAAQTIQNLDLQIGVLDLNVAMNALVASKSLRRFSLTLLRLEYDLDSSSKRRLYLPMNITNVTARIKTPKWRLKQLEDFRCEMTSFRSSQVSGTVDLDHLWQLFHTIFPELRVLVWHLPVRSDGLLISLIRQKKLRYFESNMILAPFSRPLTGFVLSSLESLRIKDVQIFRGMAIPNLLHFSATCREDFIIPAGFTFMQLCSLDLKIGEGVKNLYGMSNGDFPLLKVLSLTFLGPYGNFPLLDLPSLREITISTKSPTFPQGMKFCTSLIYEPWRCPRLEQINLDSFLEWDILYLLLRQRNFLQRASVSRIKTLRLPLLPPKFRIIFVQLLAGRHISSLPFFWSLMTEFSLQGAKSRLLDQHVMGCFNCVYWGLGDCSEPLLASRLPKKYHGDDRLLTDKIEPLGLFPLYSWVMTRPVVPMFSMYKNIWIVGHRKRAERWRNEAYTWSKLHHRTLRCHKWCCNSKIMVTEHDMEGAESGPAFPSPAFFGLSEHAVFCDVIRAAIPSLIGLLEDQDREIRSAAASMLTELGAHSELREAVPTIPSLIELLQNQDYDVRSSTASTMEKLVGHARVGRVIEAVIPSFINLLESGSFKVGNTAASALATLAEHAEFRNAIHAAIPSLVGLLKDTISHVRSAAASILAKLAEHAEFRNAINPAIPSLVGLLEDEFSDVRSAAACAIATLAEHAEFRNVIHATVPSFVEMLSDIDSDVRSTAACALPKLAEYTEYRNAIHPAIPLLVELLKHMFPDVRSTAASALTKPAEHAEFRNAINPAIPSLVGLLKDKIHYVQSSAAAAATALATLAKHTEFRNAIHPAVPLLVELLEGRFSVGYGRARLTAAASALVKLAEHAEYRNAIHPAIPLLVELLKHMFPDVRSTAVSTLAKLAEHTEIRKVIHAAIPLLVELLKDRYFDVRSAAASALTKLAEHGELPPDIIMTDSPRSATGP